MPVGMFAFFEFMWRVLGIGRWGIMIQRAGVERLGEHSLEVAKIAYRLVELHNQNGGKLSAAKAAVYGIFHDALEIFTGDIPTPVKQFGGGKMKKLADELENVLLNLLLGYLPEQLRQFYRDAFTIPVEYKQYVKAADYISAYRKAQKEVAAGNTEFNRVLSKFETLMANSPLPEVSIIMKEGEVLTGNLDMQFQVFVVTHALALIKSGDADVAAEVAAKTLTSLASPLAQAAVQVVFVQANRQYRESLMGSASQEVQHFIRQFVPPGTDPITLDDLLDEGEVHLLGGAE